MNRGGRTPSKSTAAARARRVRASASRLGKAYKAERVTREAITRHGNADLEAAVYVMHVISEGVSVMFGTRRSARRLFLRVQDAAQQALMHLLTREPNQGEAPRVYFGLVCSPNSPPSRLPFVLGTGLVGASEQEI